MMGPRQRRDAKLFYTGVNLEERVDPQHPLRKIAAAVDFAFVRQEVAGRYGVRGHPSLDPTLVLKLLFILFYENVASERELLRQLPCRLDWLWFLALDLDSPIPDHSVLSKARRRWGREVFTRFFQKIVGQCVAAGLVDGSRVHLDGSLIAADADAGQLTLALQLTGEALYGQLEAAGEGGEGRAQVPAAAPAPGPVAPPVAAPAAVPASPPAAPPPGVLYSPTDPEARLTRKYGRSVLGYKDHRVVDDRCGIITATLTTAASVAEASLLEAALDAHEAHTGRAARQPTADKGYGTAENYRRLQARGCTPCIPHPAVREDPTKFPRTRFLYDPRADLYRCPAGQELHRRGAPSHGRYRYQTAHGVCGACPLREPCTASRTRRVLSRQVHQEAIDWADSCLSPWPRRRRMRRRRIRAEGSFADGSNRHGYKRARWRGLERVTIQNLLIATTQNLRKLIRPGLSRPRCPAGRLPLRGLALGALPATARRARRQFQRLYGRRHRTRQRQTHISENGSAMAN